MDIAVQRCSDEVKQRQIHRNKSSPDCPLNRTLKSNLQPWRVLVFDTSGNDLIQSKRKTYEFLQGSDIPSRPYA